MDNLRLDTRLVALDADLSSREEALTLAGDLFFRSGCTGGEYGQAMLERERRYPTGLAGRRLGIAIPHADGDRVLESAAAVIVPRRPVVFGLMGSRGETVECHVIVPFALRHAGLQPFVLRKLMKLLMDEDRLEHIRQARDRKEVLELLREIRL